MTSKITAAEAIKWFENKKAATVMSGAVSMYDVAIAALRAQQEREEPKPLTLDELYKAQGEPVYIFDLFEKDWTSEGWAVGWFFDDLEIFSASGKWFLGTEYGKMWLAYRYRPKEGASCGQQTL